MTSALIDVPEIAGPRSNIDQTSYLRSITAFFKYFTLFARV